MTAPSHGLILGALTAWDRSGAEKGALIPTVARLMEDYATERVREALTAAADAIEEVGAAPEYAVELIEAIRELDGEVDA